MSNQFLKSGFAGLIILSAVSALPGKSISVSAAAQDYSSAQTINTSKIVAGKFSKKQKAIRGDWEIVRENGQTKLIFSSDFKAANGPDLKVFLSPQNLSDVSGKTATRGALKLDVLKSSKGSQTYIIPENVNLSNFSSVLVHCEAYSVLWGGGSLS